MCYHFCTKTSFKLLSAKFDCHCNWMSWRSICSLRLYVNVFGIPNTLLDIHWIEYLFIGLDIHWIGHPLYWTSIGLNFHCLRHPLDWTYIGLDFHWFRHPLIRTPIGCPKNIPRQVSHPWDIPVLDIGSLNLPDSQTSPVKPDSQLHSNAFVPSLQFPEFWHGELSHSFTSKP